MRKVLITGSDLPYKDEEKKILKDIAEVIIDDTWDKRKILEIIPEVEGLLVDVGVNIDAVILDKARNLKIIVEYGVGVDNIDIDSASKKGIFVCNLPDVFTVEVAEFTISLMLCLVKGIVKENYDIKKRIIWDPNLYQTLLVEGKKLGFIGYGKIARKIKHLMENFKVKFLAYDPFIDEEVLEKEKVEKCDLISLLKRADIVSIHVPLTKKTENLINQEKLNYMKKNSVIVNVSRGSVINEKDLYNVLKNKKIFGAALDVLADEPIKSNNLLTKLDNVIITPHIAWKSEQSVKNVEIKAAEKIKDYFLGKNINGIINRKELIKINDYRIS